jgi:DNA-directed RNA polymerase subunit RPC12/RpoP
MDDKTIRKGKYLTVEEMIAKIQEGKEEKGLVCPACGCRHFITRRTTPGEGTVRRVRVCRNCGRKRVTVES